MRPQLTIFDQMTKLLLADGNVLSELFQGFIEVRAFALRFILFVRLNADLDDELEIFSPHLLVIFAIKYDVLVESGPAVLSEPLVAPLIFERDFAELFNNLFGPVFLESPTFLIAGPSPLNWRCRGCFCRWSRRWRFAQTLGETTA